NILSQENIKKEVENIKKEIKKQLIKELSEALDGYLLTYLTEKHLNSLRNIKKSITDLTTQQILQYWQLLNDETKSFYKRWAEEILKGEEKDWNKLKDEEKQSKIDKKAPELAKEVNIIVNSQLMNTLWNTLDNNFKQALLDIHDRSEEKAKKALFDKMWSIQKEKQQEVVDKFYKENLPQIVEQNIQPLRQAKEQSNIDPLMNTLWNTLDNNFKQALLDIHDRSEEKAKKALFDKMWSIQKEKQQKVVQENIWEWVRKLLEDREISQIFLGKDRESLWQKIQEKELLEASAIQALLDINDRDTQKAANSIYSEICLYKILHEENKPTQTTTSSQQSRSPPENRDGGKLINQQSKFFNFVPFLILASTFSLDSDLISIFISFLTSPSGILFLIGIVIGILLLPKILLLSEDTKENIFLGLTLLSVPIFLYLLFLITHGFPLNQGWPYILGGGIISGMILFALIWRFIFPVSWYAWRLKSEDSYVREQAAIALGEIGDKRAIEPLINTLKDRNSDVRKYAAIALGKIGDKKAVEPLINALEDKSWGVCKHAIIALGKIGDKKAIELLINVLRTDWIVREQAAIALVKISQPAIEPLINALKDKNPGVRKQVAIAYIKIAGIPQAKSENRELLEKLKASEDIRVEENLLYIDYPEAKLFIQKLKEKGMPIDYAIRKALPEVIRATKGNREWFKLAINLGIRLADKEIYPCSTLEYGVPLAVKCSKGNVEWYKENLKALEELAIDLANQNMNTFRTLTEGKEVILKFGINPFKFRESLLVAKLIPKWFKKARDKNLEDKKLRENLPKLINSNSSLKILKEIIMFEVEFVGKKKLQTKIEKISYEEREIIIGTETIEKTVQVHTDGKWCGPCCPYYGDPECTRCGDVHLEKVVETIPIKKYIKVPVTSYILHTYAFPITIDYWHKLNTMTLKQVRERLNQLRQKLDSNNVLKQQGSDRQLPDGGYTLKDFEEPLLSNRIQDLLKEKQKLAELNNLFAKLKTASPQEKESINKAIKRIIDEINAYPESLEIIQKADLYYTEDLLEESYLKKAEELILEGKVAIELFAAGAAT
ncbi:MAG: hypothetical protein DRP72_03565, partial [Candidatus Omnitrophota bacterium]